MRMDATRLPRHKEVCEPVFPPLPNNGVERKEHQPRPLRFHLQQLHSALRCFCVFPYLDVELLEKLELYLWIPQASCRMGGQ